MTQADVIFNINILEYSSSIKCKQILSDPLGSYAVGRARQCLSVKINYRIPGEKYSMLTKSFLYLTELFKAFSVLSFLCFHFIFSILSSFIPPTSCLLKGLEISNLFSHSPSQPFQHHKEICAGKKLKASALFVSLAIANSNYEESKAIRTNLLELNWNNFLLVCLWVMQIFSTFHFKFSDGNNFSIPPASMLLRSTLKFPLSRNKF